MMRSPAVREATSGSTGSSAGTARDEHEAVAGAQAVRRPGQWVPDLDGIPDEPPLEDVAPEDQVLEAADDAEVERVVARRHDVEAGAPERVGARAHIEVLQVPGHVEREPEGAEHAPLP